MEGDGGGGGEGGEDLPNSYKYVNAELINYKT